ncbi:serine/threonine-protein phosphatase [Methylococcaceae bacterium WWC4]|nr:serine/threonine-protein phosphatase [Methylococcaceae bacterium WWC4]
METLMTVTRLLESYYAYGLSDPGLARAANEDAISINAAAGLCLLADGMGGHGQGDVASRQVVASVNDLIGRYLPAAAEPFAPSWFERWFKRRDGADRDSLERQLDLLADIIREANRTLYRDNQARGAAEGCGIGTTLVGCRLARGSAKMQVFHVGDSRLYRLRGNALQALTKDHSLYRQWQDTGRTGEAPPANRLYQAIGPKPAIVPDVQLVEFAAGDSVLLCSDGLTGMLEDGEIADLLGGLTPDNLPAKAGALIDAANANGGTDNISVILLCQ